MKKNYIYLLLFLVSFPSYSQITTEWVKTYNGLGNSTDQLNDMTADAFGNVYVTGSTIVTAPYTDYATIKYNSDGVEQWTAIYNGTGNKNDRAAGIAVDASGNVYVTGAASEVTSGVENSDIVTIKYNSSGVEQWVKKFNGNYEDGATAIALDNLGNIYVTGQTIVTISTYPYDYVTIKYDPSGVEQWVQTYNGTANSIDYPNSIVTDALGNAYVTGYSDGLGTGLDMLTIKYNTFGVEQWVQRYNGPADTVDIANSITVDKAGNVIIAGRSSYAPFSPAFTTIKYNSSGVEQWVNRYTDAYSEALSLASDKTGNVYVTGYIDQPFNYDLILIKNDSFSNMQWETTYDARGHTNYNDFELGKSVVVDSVGLTGFVYVLGFAYNPVEQIRKVVLLIYYPGFNVYFNTTGNSTVVPLLLFNPVEYPILYGEIAQLKVIENFIIINGIKYYKPHIYLAGSISDGINSDYIIMKYSPLFPRFLPSRFEVHTNKSISSNGTTSDTMSIAQPPPNKISAYPIIYGVRVGIDTVIFPNVGDLELYLTHEGISDTLIYQPGIQGENFINTVFDDSSENQIINGTAPFTGTFKPHSPLSVFNETSLFGDWVLEIYNSSTGNTGVLNAWSLEILLQDDAVSSDIKTLNNLVPDNFILYQNFPNPFNPSTNIRFSLPERSPVKIIVYNLLGEIVTTLLDEVKEAGNYELKFIALGISSGIYFYSIQSGNFSKTRKMILIK